MRDFLVSDPAAAMFSESKLCPLLRVARISTTTRCARTLKLYVLYELHGLSASRYGCPIGTPEAESCRNDFFHDIVFSSLRKLFTSNADRRHWRRVV